MQKPKPISIGERASPHKRGSHGPSPARRLTLQDNSNARKAGGLTISTPDGVVLAATKAACTQDGIETYAAMRRARFEHWQAEVELPALVAKGWSDKRILREMKRTEKLRYQGTAKEREVNKATPCTR